MRSLTGKLRLSYGLLIVIIIAVGGWAIYHFAHLGRAVDVILVNNYKSIIASEKMKEALERIDSASMFFIALHQQEARSQFADNSISFSEEFRIASGNITEPGEREIVADIDSQYSAYKRDVEEFLKNAAARSAAENS